MVVIGVMTMDGHVPNLPNLLVDAPYMAVVLVVADLAVVPVDVLYMTAERVDAHIRTGEWIDVMVAVLIVVIAGNRME